MSSESKPPLPETASDLPPESFVLSEGEFEWSDRNAIMQRKTSLKLGLNSDFNSFSHRSTVVYNKKLSAPSVFALSKVHKTGNPPEKKPLLRSRMPYFSSVKIAVSEREEATRLKIQKITEEAEQIRLATEFEQMKKQRILREIEERELQQAQALLQEAEKHHPNKKKNKTGLEGVRKAVSFFRRSWGRAVISLLQWARSSWWG